MSSHHLVLHQHPFASFCWKPLIALYELDLPFESHVVDDEAARGDLARLWPIGRIPVLRDETVDLTLPESSTIIEYLDALAPSPGQLIPDDPDRALHARLWDRVLDDYVATPMQSIVGDSLVLTTSTTPPAWPRRAKCWTKRSVSSTTISRATSGSPAPISRSQTAPPALRSSTAASSSPGTRIDSRTSPVTTATSCTDPQSSVSSTTRGHTAASFRCCGPMTSTPTSATTTWLISIGHEQFGINHPVPETQVWRTNHGH